MWSEEGRGCADAISCFKDELAVTLRGVFRFFKRVVAILFGGGYLTGFSFVLSLVTESSPLICQLMTFGAAGAIMMVLVVFGERSLRQRAEGIRFSISTLLLFVVPLAIYLAAARLFALRLMRQRPTGVAIWIVSAAFAIVMMVITTVVLLLMAEAIVWLLVSAQRIARGTRAMEVPSISSNQERFDDRVGP